MAEPREAKGIGIASLMREIELCGGRIALRVAEAHHLPNEAGAVVWDAALCLAHFLEGAPPPRSPPGCLQAGFWQSLSALPCCLPLLWLRAGP